MQAIKTMGTVKQYGDAVDSVSLEIDQGELFALLGVNGAGKTTMVKILSCLTKPTLGDALVGGYLLYHQKKY
ncbi:MAG: ATP-binding cassette domain-containing protein [Oscillospiraceae bacterium]|nr:ATP-binding cassette domain-containing protein [Oscillospiraceae bacterium]